MPSPKPMVQDGFDYREMNDAELAQYEIDQAQAKQDAVENKKKAKEKQAIIERLGLTADELSILLS
jgi:hypothetical protein